jgi:sugar O-acyltransferase (sialic acid O-acetyltransferase NeuD family)
MTKRNLAIFGAGRHGRVVAEIASLIGWSKIVFFDDRPNHSDKKKLLVCGNKADFISQSSHFDGCFVAIGNNSDRSEIVKILLSSEAPLVSLIHPSAIVSQYSEVGAGTVVMAGAIINPFTKVGISSIINTGSTIDHDNVLHDYVHISPGVNTAGGVTVGKFSWVGIGASVINSIMIGDNVIIGAGSVVIKDIPDNVTALGSPAKIRE